MMSSVDPVLRIAVHVPIAQAADAARAAMEPGTAMIPIAECHAKLICMPALGVHGEVHAREMRRGCVDH